MQKTTEQPTHIGNPVSLDEKARTYFYVRGGITVQVTLTNVVELIARQSGSHRIKTKDGKLHYMPSDFYHIEIEDASKQWTV